MMMHFLLLFPCILLVPSCSTFPCNNHKQRENAGTLLSYSYINNDYVQDKTKRASFTFILSLPTTAYAATFTPGGTLVEREIGVRVGNKESALSRNSDNSNVLFKEDNYFKFGTAAPWIEPNSTDFPKTIPFVLTQQRYDGLKKYKSRVEAGIESILLIEEKIPTGDYGSIPIADDPIYGLRPMGLLANAFLASENTGTTNELLLTRYYINEVYLRINEFRRVSSRSEAIDAFTAIKKAINSYLSIMNRAISGKVGEKFNYI